MTEPTKEVSDVSTIVIRRAKPIDRYIESRIEITPRDSPPVWAWRGKSASEVNNLEIAWYRDWASTLKEFLRDHRSQDVQDVTIRIITKKVCSECGREWDVCDNEGVLVCGYCEAEVEHGV